MNITCLETKLIERNSSINLYLESIKNYSVPTADEEVELFNRMREDDNEARNRIIMGHQRIVFSFAKQYAKSNAELIDYVNEGNVGLIKAMETFDVTKGFKFMTYAQHYVRREMNYYLKTTSMLVERSNFAKLDPKIRKINNDYYSINGYYPTISTIKNILSEEYGIEVKNNSDLYDMMFSSSDIPKNSDLFDYDFNVEYNKKTLSVNSYVNNIESDYNKTIVSNMLSTLTERERDIISMAYGIGDYDYEYSTDDIAIKYNKTTACINSIKKKAMAKMKANTSVRIAV